LYSVFKHDPNIPDSEVTPAYLMEHLWLVGSPQQLPRKIEQLYEVSGVRHALMLVYDHCQQQAGWERSTRLLTTEVLPKVAGLVPA
jgi:alkanesulfonate monooxygenase SsuD/methylene tetrahydromethanopterin reductase-like flavin-dependent oxidoreductase (luciferase family)